MLRGLIASFILVALCVLIHTFGLVLLSDWLIRHPRKAEPEFSVRRYSLKLTSVFVIITLMHLGETFIWAAFYAWWGHFNNFETSWYFSVSSYTTIGYGDVLLPARWRMLGGVEGINGVLLCGLSTAFLFAIINQMFTSRLLQRSKNAGIDVSTDAL
jgi:hypothetical protein